MIFQYLPRYVHMYVHISNTVATDVAITAIDDFTEYVV